jgi:hypothetical protein
VHGSSPIGGGFHSKSQYLGFGQKTVYSTGLQQGIRVQGSAQLASPLQVSLTPNAQSANQDSTRRRLQASESSESSSSDDSIRSSFDELVFKFQTTTDTDSPLYTNSTTFTTVCDVASSDSLSTYHYTCPISNYQIARTCDGVTQGTFVDTCPTAFVLCAQLNMSTGGVGLFAKPFTCRALNSSSSVSIVCACRAPQNESTTVSSSRGDVATLGAPLIKFRPKHTFYQFSVSNHLFYVFFLTPNVPFY